jgi:hypothetical protein
MFYPGYTLIILLFYFYFYFYWHTILYCVNVPYWLALTQTDPLEAVTAFVYNCSYTWGWPPWRAETCCVSWCSKEWTQNIALRTVVLFDSENTKASTSIWRDVPWRDRHKLPSISTTAYLNPILTSLCWVYWVLDVAGLRPERDYRLQFKFTPAWRFVGIRHSGLIHCLQMSHSRGVATMLELVDTHICLLQ